MCYCVRLKPDQQNVLMAGTQDKKILQWDLDSGDLVQVGQLATERCGSVCGLRDVDISRGRQAAPHMGPWQQESGSRGPGRQMERSEP